MSDTNKARAQRAQVALYLDRAELDGLDALAESYGLTRNKLVMSVLRAFAHDTMILGTDGHVFAYARGDFRILAEAREWLKRPVAQRRRR